MVAEKKNGTYTAIALGEILFARHFTASKQVNPFSAAAKNEVSTKMFANNDGTFEKVAKVVPEPQRLMTMLDAFDSVRAQRRHRGLHRVVAGHGSRQPYQVPADPRLLEKGLMGGRPGAAGPEKVRPGTTRVDVRAFSGSVQHHAFHLACAPAPSGSPATGSPGQPFPPLPPTQPVQPRVPRFPVAVLSFFDGIATAVVALKSWVCSPSSFGPGSLTHRPYRSHPLSAKFAQFATWLKTFLSLSPFKVAFLVENVLMSASLQSELDNLLSATSFLCDASSWGVVSRPRLWWSNIFASSSFLSVASCYPVRASSLEEIQPHFGNLSQTLPCSRARSRILPIRAFSRRCGFGQGSAPVFDNPCRLARWS